MTINTVPTQEPNYGRRLLPQVLDQVAQDSPHKVYTSIPLSDTLPYDFRDITFAEVAKCVNFVAHWLEERLGRSESFEALAFFGVADLRGTIFFYAALKVGYKVLLLSPRNPPETNVSLIERVECCNVCYVEELAPIIGKLKKMNREKISYSTIPAFDNMLESEVDEYIFEGTFEDCENNPIVIFHSSGSTGPPKPIQMTHGTFATIDNDRRLAQIEGRLKQDFTIFDFTSSSRFYFSFPPFHLAGFICLNVVPVFSDTAIAVLGPPLKPPTGFIASDILRLQDIKALFVPPVIVEQLLDEPGTIDYLKRMDWVCYAGGPLSHSAGESLKDYVNLCQYFGTTETSNIPQLLPSREDWAYMEWHPACSIEMQTFDPDEGTFEMVHFPNASTHAHSPLNHNLPGIGEWRTKDLFKHHPTNNKLWKFSGRVDDIVVLSNGHKFNPVPAEALVQEHTTISGALVIGQGRFQPALLLELRDHKPDTSSVIDKLWPVIEQANKRLPGQGRIVQSRVLIVPANKPFHRTPKGTIVRKLTEKAFAAEIEKLYIDNNDTIDKDDIPAWQTFEEESLRRLLHMVLSKCLPKTKVSEHVDFFLMGLDSLKAVDMVKSLRAALRNRLQPPQISKLSTRLVYENPSIEKLAKAISALLNPVTPCNVDGSEGQGDDNRVAVMTEMVKQFTKGLTDAQFKSPKPQEKGSIQIALTGSTGSLGAHLLRAFARSPQVKRIWSLDRSSDAPEKHQSNPILSSLDSSRVNYVNIDIDQPRLGLQEAEWSTMLANVDIIVHNAWKVDFNQTLPSFENHLHGTRSILDWSIESPKRPHIVFISSISSVTRWPQVYGPKAVPEEPLRNPEVASKMGYGESKFVAENVLRTGHERTKVPITILRVGQIAGSTNPSDAAWPMQEWLPAVVKTSKTLGKIPSGLPPIDWIPIDKLATIILELITADASSEILNVYNLVNPNVVPWSAILPSLRQYCGEESEVVPLSDWLEELERIDVDLIDESELTAKPALKVVSAIEELMDARTEITYSTERGVNASQSMRELGPVNVGWLQGWLRQWG